MIARALRYMGSSAWTQRLARAGAGTIDGPASAAGLKDMRLSLLKELRVSLRKEIETSAKDTGAQLAELHSRTEQLEAIVRLDWEQQKHVPELGEVLDVAQVITHVTRAIDRAVIDPEPFPHIVVENWLPMDLYRALVRGVPPPCFFGRRQQVTVPFEMAPAYGRRVWGFLANAVIKSVVKDALASKFQDSVQEYVRRACGLGQAAPPIPLAASDGRILLRRPGYVIAPHRDPKWGFVTGLVYLARPGDNERYGTQLYAVRNDVEAEGEKPLYLDESQCDLVRDVPFRPNTLLAFLNSHGAHGASIPADAQPADFERYIYQFRLGPQVDTIRYLLSLMPDDRRRSWGGLKTDRAVANDAYDMVQPAKQGQSSGM